MIRRSHTLTENSRDDQEGLFHNTVRMIKKVTYKYSTKTLNVIRKVTYTT